MGQLKRIRGAVVVCGVVALAAVGVVIGQGRGGSQFPGGANPDGSLRPTPPVRNLFTQDAYTEYEILSPGSESFRIKFLPENSRAGATEIVNDTRGGSEGTGIEVYDPRTGNPIKFTYEVGATPDAHAIHAPLPFPVPEGGIGRVLIYKTYKDARTYMMNGEDIVWVRSLSGYRLGVVLPKGFAFLSSNVAAQLSTTATGQLRLAFANPSGQSNPVTIHARKTAAAFSTAPYTDMFFDDVKTLYDLGAPETGTFAVQQTYSDYRKGPHARLDSLSYLALKDLKVIDLDTAKALTPMTHGDHTMVALDVPIVNDRQSAHLRLTGTIADGSYKLEDGNLVFTRTLRGLRNTVLLPEGWEVSAVSQSGTIGRTAQGRAFVALINLNAENEYTVTIRARMASAPRLVTAAWLGDHLNDADLVLLHVGGARDYATHIPGARLVTLGDVAAMDTSDTGPNLQMLPADQLKVKLEGLGISDASRIVIYPGTNAVQSATRVMLTLDYAGLGDRASLLDGGLTGWVRDGRPTSDAAPAVKQGSLKPLTLVPLVVDSTFVREHLKTPGYAIVDARAKSLYDGTTTGGSAARPHKTGHIEGALNVPFSEITNGESQFRTLDELRKVFDAAGVKPGDTVVAYCHIGQQATATIFGARLLGYSVRLYDGSFEEWSRLPNAPVTNPSAKGR